MKNTSFEWIKENLYVAAVCDILDELGYRQQAMHQRLRPLQPDHCVFIGRARTLRWMEVDYKAEGNYDIEILAMDSLKPGDVVVHSQDLAGTNAPWGELMSTAAKMRGAVGCVCDSQIRDCLRIMELNFPVFYTGIRPLDSSSRGQVMAYDTPVRCGDVLVNPGDIVYADFDGVVVIPKEAEEKVFILARDKAQRENMSRDELLKGRTLGEVFAKYGAL
jgi:regulator of RNase E activity RraA